MSGTAVITGVTRGLGRALALGLARRGWTIEGCGRSSGDLERLAGELGDGHHLRRLDVTGDEVGPWAEAVVERSGAPDLLLNNAALINNPANLWEVSRKEFQKLVDVNLVGVHAVLRAFLPSMLARRAGVVVNFSSGWGRSTSPQVAPYCATKWGIEGLTRALAQELPAGLAAVALNPGAIDTDMLRSAWGASAAAYPSADAWAERAVPFLIGLKAADNGRSLDVPA